MREIEVIMGVRVRLCLNRMCESWQLCVWSTSPFVNFHFVNVDQVGIDKVGSWLTKWELIKYTLEKCDGIYMDEKGKYTCISTLQVKVIQS